MQFVLHDINYTECCEHEWPCLSPNLEFVCNSVGISLVECYDSRGQKYHAAKEFKADPQQKYLKVLPAI